MTDATTKQGMSRRVEFQEPEHRLATLVIVGGVFGVAIAGLEHSKGALGVLVGVGAGLMIGYVASLPKRWVLDGDELRQVYPRRAARSVQLREVMSLVAERRLQGGYDLWLVPKRGYRVAMPSHSRRRGDRFRQAVFQRLPADVLAHVEDPLVLEVLAMAARSTTGQHGRDNGV